MVTRNSCNTYIGATVANEITMPAQPAFLTIMSSSRLNVTGDGTTYTIVWGTEIYDQNNDFDNVSTFTSPVTGVYQFDGTVMISNLAAGNDIGQLRINTSNTNWLPRYQGIGALRYNNQYTLFRGMLVDMDAGDTCSLAVAVSSTTKVVAVAQAGATDPRTCFSGYLVG